MHAADKCLIVEDASEWVEFLREVPEEARCEVRIATSLAEARGLIEREFFHVALVDLSLTEDESDRGGLRVLGWLNDLKEGTQSILVTLHGTMEVGFEVKDRYGAIGAVAKQGFEKNSFSGLFQKALQAAQYEQKRLSQRIPYPEVELLRGDRAVNLWEYDVTSALGPGSTQPIHTLLHSLFEPLVPLMVPKTTVPSLIDKSQRLVRCSFWSRALGQPVKVVFGQKLAVKRLRAELPANARIVAEDERPELSGFAEVDAAAEFDYFKSPFEQVTSEARS